MQHSEEHGTEAKKSIHTNGSGLLLLTAVAVLLALFCWNMWKGADKEADHYRFTKKADTEHHEAGADHHEEEAHH